MGTKTSGTTTNALTYLHENHWFPKEVCKLVFINDLLRAHFNPPEERQKLIDTIGRYPVLCFVGGYPLPPNLNSKAESVTQAFEAFGSNVALARLKLDTLRANFISEQEAKNLLAPLDHALARKQEQESLIRKQKSPSRTQKSP